MNVEKMAETGNSFRAQCRPVSHKTNGIPYELFKSVSKHIFSYIRPLQNKEHFL